MSFLWSSEEDMLDTNSLDQAGDARCPSDWSCCMIYLLDPSGHAHRAGEMIC
jgi:hypothetical protein